ncbi:MAG: sortase [Mycobacteriales bacterium]|nr:sortase [Mycobacteriales bacterium]
MPVVAGLLALDLAVAGGLVLLRTAVPAAVADPGPGVPLTAALGALRAGAPPTVTTPRVRVPALEVDAPVIGLATRDGVLDVPRTASDVGLWSAGPVPGDPGAAVLVGHVDLDGVPGVFARLGDLRPGTRIVVRRPDGRDATFLVDRVQQHAKTAFPTDEVYAPTERPSLRLVTCGGAFDRRTGHYRDNVVAFAVLA